MTKEQLDKYIGRNVTVEFTDGNIVSGVLGYIKVKSGRYTVGIWAFVASQVKKITNMEIEHKEWQDKDVKNFLRRYITKKESLFDLRGKLYNTAERLSSLQNITDDFKPIDTQRRMAKLIDDKTEIEKKIELYENQINYLKYEILDYINYLTDINSAEVLKLKYIDSLTIKEIARRLNYSEQWVFKKQKDGVAELKEILSSK